MSEEWSFEKDDFLTTTPYEALYAYHKEPFTHAAKMEELAAYSVSKGFKGFKTMYKKYVESLKAQSGTIYIDNVTNFTNQPLELNAGDWEADDSGIFKKNGYNDEVACPHPIMPVERLVNIDTGEEKLQLAFRKGTIWRKIIVSKTVLASSNILDRAFPDTATGEDLDRKCMERGVIRRQASAAVRKGVFTSSSGAAFSVPIGTRFSGGEINYIITGALNTPGAYSLTSETPGEIGNGFYGTLLPIDFVDGLAGAELEDILIPGKDTESDDSLRERYFNSYDNQAFGGNQSDYKERVSALAGVGGVKVFRTPSGGGTVGLTIVDSEWSVPSSTLIASVQNAVDPLTDQGSGIGFAPIGHTVTVSGVTGRTINTKFKLTLENNVSWPDVQAAVTAAIRGYFQSLIKLWADSEAITVRISQIETRVLAVPGVLDVENTTLNAVGANIQLTGTEIPVLGEVSNGTA